jgi:hypothetical protein
MSYRLQDDYDIYFCMALGTILHDESTRFRTFERLAGLMHPGSFLILITGSGQRLFAAIARKKLLHTIDRRDIEKLKDLGFEITSSFHWSSSPKAWWQWQKTRNLARIVERIGRQLGIGARKVVICEKMTVAS